MKKLFCSLLILMSCCDVVSAQTATFKVRSKVYIKNPNSNFPILYSPKKEVTDEAASNIYTKSGFLIQTVNTIKKDWVKATPFTFDEDVYKNLQGKKFLYADLLQSADKTQVQIFFWPFKEEEIKQNDSGNPVVIQEDTAFNAIIKKGNFYIELEPRKYLRFKTKARHAGPITIPFKVYLTSRDDDHTSNVKADVNAGVYYGWKWGNKGFVNLPAEAAGKSHERSTSFNLIAGFSQVDVTKANSIDASVVEGSVLSFSPGFGVGYHYDTFGIFLALGIDMPVGNSVAEKWRYKNQPWLGFGVGFSIFK